MNSTPEERIARKKKIMLARSLRMPVNDVVLEVQKGIIDINDLFTLIATRVKEKKDG